MENQTYDLIEYDDVFNTSKIFQNKTYEILKQFIVGRKFIEEFGASPKAIYFLDKNNIISDETCDIIFYFEKDQTTKAWNRNNKIMKIYSENKSELEIISQVYESNHLLKDIYKNNVTIIF